ncbi:MAG TPA: HlyD family secretion protein, partial [Desulfosarcina sp.]|nr:HlyD family secretion protein [Desulfosarcina sp.]
RRRHRVPAPKGWIVVEKMVEAGEIVAAQKPLGRVGDYRRLIVPLSVTTDELAAIRDMGDNLAVSLEGRPIRATLNWVNPEFDEQTRKLGIELLLSADIPEHRGGLRLTLPLLLDAEGIWIPKAAVVDRYENPRVILKTTGDTIRITVLGETDGHLIAAADRQLPVGTELAAP